MKRKMNEIEGFTFEGILQLSEKKWGDKYTMGITDILYLHHLRERKICGSSEDDMKRYLMKDGYNSIDTLNMIKRYNKVKNELLLKKLKKKPRAGHQAETNIEKLVFQ